MSKTITVTKTISAPPDGWEYQDRMPVLGEERMYFSYDSVWHKGDKDTHNPWKNMSYAYRIADTYAEKYEALKLPDGWAWKSGMSDGTEWSNCPFTEQDLGNSAEIRKTLRRIINGKAYPIEVKA